MSTIIATSTNWKLSVHKGFKENYYSLRLTTEVDGFNHNPEIVMSKEQLEELLSFNNIPLE